MKYKLADDIAVLHFDDGKVNAVGHDFIDAMNEGLDRAEAEAKAVVIRGREGLFSGGFDLSEFKKGPEAALALAGRGLHLLTRIYGHPQPVVAACTGHAIAMGAFILLASDTRIGIEGDFRTTLPETAIGMNFHPVLFELVASRLSKRHETRALIQANIYDPAGAIAAGFLDEIVIDEALDARVMSAAQQLAQLPTEVYGKNKRDCRAASLQRMQDSLE
ncbi:MAG: crotonase/enoyl-CoA hydratase family protein [Halieaceae bacterium]|jgi:enoyl-CoA hydratase|nr:crotonase/enoyl-CoA hydratase family protein [Halieaceae bacterium]